MKINSIFYSLLIILILSNCASKKYKDINYLEETVLHEEVPALNIFVPRKKSDKKLPVFLFVHGGSWTNGNKDMYGFIGRNFAKQDVISVIPGYTLSPDANYDGMAKQIAQAIEWTHVNIHKYNGDPNRIYISGHSAGGHLVALVATNPKYLNEKSKIAGVILNDAAGLDRVNHFKDNPPTSKNNYITTWTLDPVKWRDASPIYFIDNNTPPLKIYLGSKTYESIKISNDRFIKELNKFQPEVSLQFLNKKHIPMITQFFWPWNKRYDQIVEFMLLNP